MRERGQLTQLYLRWFLCIIIFVVVIIGCVNLYESVIM